MAWAFLLLCFSLDMREDSAESLLFMYFISLCLRGIVIQESGRHAIKAGRAVLSRDQTLSRLRGPSPCNGLIETTFQLSESEFGFFFTSRDEAEQIQKEKKEIPGAPRNNTPMRPFT